MRVLCAGDIHGDLSVAKKLAAKARASCVDLVVLCGDVFGRGESKGIVKAFDDLGKRVLFVNGNHEAFFVGRLLESMYPSVKDLHGNYYVVGDVGFFGCGGANVGFGLDDLSILDVLKKASVGVSNVNKRVMVTHVHPRGSMIEKFSHFVFGSAGVSMAIDYLKPDLVVCSHVHEADGVSEDFNGTKVICAGRKGVVVDL